MNILILEDDVAVQKVLQRMLATLHVSAVFATDGIHAIQLIHDYLQHDTPIFPGLFDLIIPGGLGGIATLRKIHRFCLEFKAIVMSGSQNNPIMDHPTRYGLSAKLNKPFGLAEIHQVLIPLLKNH